MWRFCETCNAGRRLCWRKVQEVHYRDGASDYVGWQVVCWNDKRPCLIAFKELSYANTRYRHEFTRPSPAEHVAFVAGDMPAPVYADWLEENVPDVPADALRVLRGWL